MKYKKSVSAAVFLVLLTVFIPTTAMAKSLFEHQSTVIPESQSVDDVVVIGGDATIYGSVQGSVIVFNGNAEIKASAHIKGVVLVVGGNVQQEPGAVINDQVINISFDNAVTNSLLIGAGLVIAIWLIQIVGSLLFVLLSSLTIFLGKRRMDPLINLVKQAPWRMLYIGLFSSLLLFAITLLLIVTVVGIPLAMLLLLFVLVSFILGLAFISFLVGEKIQGSFGKAPWLITAMGAGVVIAALNIPIVGVFLLLGISWISLGMTTTWIWEKLKRKKTP